MATPPMSSRAPQQQASSRVLLALVVAALVSGGLIAGLLVIGIDAGDDRPGEGDAAGLRADALPGGLAGRPAPQFHMTDGRGGVVDTRSLRGRPSAVTFLYTHCPDVCPTIAAALGRALDRVPGAAAVAVSVDPRGDTPAAVRAFAKARRLPATFRYGVGDRSALEPVWRAYFVSAQPGGAGASSHTAAVWLVDARGRLRGMYPGGATLSAADLAHDLRLLGPAANEDGARPRR